MWLVAVLALVQSSCSSQPQSPELRQGEAVYRNEQEGFHFAPPPGWRQHAQSDLPPGTSEQERLLVKYKRMPPNKPVFFHVSMVDVSESATLDTFLARRSPGKNWARQTKGEKIQVAGIAAIRESFTGRWDKEDMIQESVAIRRGNRVYFFAGYFPVADTKARTQVRIAVSSIAWDKS